MVIDAVPVAMLSGRLNEGSIQLVLSRSSPSYRLFRWQLGVVLGKQVVLLYRNYAQDGETRVHFRAEPNTPAVHAAIQQALATPSGGT